MSELSDQELALLHLLKLENNPVGISFFEYIERKKPEYGDYTFTQRYTPVFKHVQRNLIRKGILLMSESIYEKTKMERLRLIFPNEFAKYLPPILKQTTSFQTKGETHQKEIRAKLMEVMKRGDTSTYSGNTAKLCLFKGELCLGNKKLTVDLLKKWQRERWNKLAWDAKKEKSQKKSPGKVLYYTKAELSRAINAKKVEEKKFPEIINHAMSQLSSGEWILPGELSTVLRAFYFGATAPEAKVICETGWKQGCLAKHTSGGKDYYRLPPNSEQEQKPSNYLKMEDSYTLLDIQTIPYESLIHIAAISSFQVIAKQIILSPNPILMGRANDAAWNHPQTLWLKKNSPLFQKAINKVGLRRGKQIIHENLLIAKVKDLSLKVQIQKKFSTPSKIVLLPNDFIAFPQALLQPISKLITKSGFAVKTISAND